MTTAPSLELARNNLRYASNDVLNLAIELGDELATAAETIPALAPLLEAVEKGKEARAVYDYAYGAEVAASYDPYSLD